MERPEWTHSPVDSFLNSHPRPPRVPFSSTFSSRASTPHSVSGRLTPRRPIGQWTQSEQQFFDKPHVSYECEKGPRVEILGLELKKKQGSAPHKRQKA